MFDAHGADVVDVHAVFVQLAAPSDVLHFAFTEHRRVVGYGAEDGHGPTHHARSNVVVHVFGAVAAGVNGGGFDAQLAAVGVVDGPVEQVGQCHPHGGFGRVAGQLDVVDGPGFQALAPAGDMDGQTVVLRVHAGGDGEHPGRYRAHGHR